jgi:hypothetical protein
VGDGLRILDDPGRGGAGREAGAPERICHVDVEKHDRDDNWDDNWDDNCDDNCDDPICDDPICPDRKSIL